MVQLLYIEASPRKDRSHSIDIARSFLETFRAARPGTEIDVLDLWREALPRFDGPTIAAKYAILGGERQTAEQSAAWRDVERVVSRLAAAERLLLSVPMWNFNVPYVLKHYIDIVTQPSLTFSFSPATGYRGLLTGKRAAVIYASAGDYTPGGGNPRPDFQKPFLEAWLRFIGIEDITTIAVQQTIGDAARFARARDEARRRAAAVAQRF